MLVKQFVKQTYKNLFVSRFRSEALLLTRTMAIQWLFRGSGRTSRRQDLHFRFLQVRDEALSMPVVSDNVVLRQIGRSRSLFGYRYPGGLS